MTRWLARFGWLGLVLISLGLSTVAQRPISAQELKVEITLTEWSVAASAFSASGDTIIFNVTNRGRLPHELAIVASFADPGQLPLDASASVVDESRVAVVRRLPAFAAGGPRSLSVDLAPGRYLLICNVPGHYVAGMTSAFRVNPALGGSADGEDSPSTLPGTGSGGLAGSAGSAQGVVVIALLGVAAVAVFVMWRERARL
ncbi:MAG TPA: hypothetical protein QGF05_06465 [Dehalococcoidia bacterium]|nr:hypothetical protein [Dehalococcoidia bacterium]